MRKWFQRFAKLSNKTKVALLLVLTFALFGGLGFAMRPQQYNASVQGAHTVNSTSTKSVHISPKSQATVDTVKIETTEEEVPFATTQTYDGTLPKDTTIVKVEGHNGKKVVKTEVRTKDGEVSRSLISETITVPPVAKVLAIGTKIVANKPSDNKDKKCTSNTSTAAASTCIAVDTDTPKCDDTGAATDIELCSDGQDDR